MRALFALLASLAFHALVLAALSGGWAPPREVPTRAVELEFAEMEAESDWAPPAPPPSPTLVGEIEPLEAPPERGEVRAPEPQAVRVREPEVAIERITALERAHVEAPPRLVKAIRPEYPRLARRRGEEGRVVLELEVSETGACADARVVVSSGSHELDEAAVRAARGATFAPATRGGRPVADRVRLPLDFRLR